MKQVKKKPAPRTQPLLIMLLGLVLVIGSLYVIIFNPFQGSEVAETPTATTAALIPYPAIERISVDDAKKALDNNQAIFVDTRDPQAYNESTILGAINIPVDEVESRMDELDKDSWIITFCT